ncbi:retrovirus-related pol polyprotein from transposon TNT 1-94 [Tanacetum coccineum]|uniref:Retrovirus-related pol polyprotein from transposon TNT 1-94 n=1 Tax=Tanacetum coccineum TaxID=301880 RepID=A0ABQ4YNW1_9ASTR
MARDGSVFVYNPDVLREQFAGLVIQQSLSFNHFDNAQTMRVFQNHLQPKYNHVEDQGGAQAIFTKEWDLSSLAFFQETEGPYYTNLPTPDEIHQFLIFERVDSNRTIKNKVVTLTPNQVLTKEVREDLKQWEELIRENMFSLEGHRDHLPACLSHILYSILVEQQYNLAYFFVKRIESAKATPKSQLPYGMFLTRLFRYVMEDYPHLDNGIYNVIDRLIYKLQDDKKCMKKVVLSSRSKAIGDIISIGSFVEALVLNHYVLVRKILMVENQNDVKVKQIRTDNGYEFKNHVLESFFDEKGISQNFSFPYTPEQNSVAERKNITLIEAARTMLNGSVLSKHFWTKADVLFFLKSFRVFNTRIQQVEETYHLTFNESMEAIRFTNTLVDEIGIDNSSRYPPDEFLQEDDPSRQYQVDSDASYYIIPLGRPPDLINTEGTHEQNVQNDQMITQPTDIPSGNNTKVSGSITESLVPDDRWSRDQHIELMNIIGDPGEGMLTRSMAVKLTAASASECLFADFLSEIEPKKVSEALKHPGWVDAMQEELNQFYRNKVWTLVPLPYGKRQEKRIYYDETFALVERMEAIRIFLAFATYMNFKVYQMDAKSAFLNGKLKEEVYVKQPPGFESSEFPDYVCKLDNALYGLKQALRAWYETLSTFLI